MPSIKAYHDIEAESWYRGDDWPIELEASLVTGIPKNRPVPEYFAWYDEYRDTIQEKDGYKYVLATQGIAEEWIRVEPAESDAADVNHDIELYRLKKASVLFPLPAGTLISVDNY